MTKVQLAQRAMFQEKMAANDVWLERGVFAIWKFQTADEQHSEMTREFNGVGFTGVDGGIMTSFGNWINKRTNGGRDLGAFGHCLSVKQKAIARRKMNKYAGQLVRIAEAK